MGRARNPHSIRPTSAGGKPPTRGGRNALRPVLKAADGCHHLGSRLAAKPHYRSAADPRACTSCPAIFLDDAGHGAGDCRIAHARTQCRAAQKYHRPFGFRWRHVCNSAAADGRGVKATTKNRVCIAGGAIFNVEASLLGCDRYIAVGAQDSVVSLAASSGSACPASGPTPQFEVGCPLDPSPSSVVPDLSSDRRTPCTSSGSSVR